MTKRGSPNFVFGKLQAAMNIAPKKPNFELIFLQLPSTSSSEGAASQCLCVHFSEVWTETFTSAPVDLEGDQQTLST